MAAVNLAGCVFFRISALASYVVPSSGSVLDLAAANWTTALGAACFFAGSLMLLPAARGRMIMSLTVHPIGGMRPGARSVVGLPPMRTITLRLVRGVAPLLAAAVCVAAVADRRSRDCLSSGVNYGPISHKGLKKAGGASTSAS